MLLVKCSEVHFAPDRTLLRYEPCTPCAAVESEARELKVGVKELENVMSNRKALLSIFQEEVDADPRLLAVIDLGRTKDKAGSLTLVSVRYGGANAC